jgi:hypothetical protein
METLLTSSLLIMRPDGTGVTNDGLVLKNVNRVERFNLRMDVRLNAEFISWQVCRIVRRDFFFITSKMLYSLTSATKAEQLRALVLDVRMLADEFVSKISDHEANPLPEVREVPMRLICSEAASLYKAFIQADQAYARLNHGLARGVIGVNEVYDYTGDFEAGISGIKLFLGGGASTKTAHELGAEEGIV